MYFIQEIGFSFELDQIASDGSHIDALTLHVEESCRCTIRGAEWGYGCTRVNWNGKIFVAWYCVNGDIVTLRSIIPACP